MRRLPDQARWDSLSFHCPIRQFCEFIARVGDNTHFESGLGKSILGKTCCSFINCFFFFFLFFFWWNERKIEFSKILDLGNYEKQIFVHDKLYQSILETACTAVCSVCHEHFQRGWRSILLLGHSSVHPSVCYALWCMA